MYQLGVAYIRQFSYILLGLYRIHNPERRETQMEIVQLIAIVLAAVGALNWGLVALFKFDLVALVAGGLKFGEVNIFSRVVYILVAISGIISLTVIGEIM